MLNINNASFYLCQQKKHPSEIPNVASLSPGKEEQQLGTAVTNIKTRLFKIIFDKSFIFIYINYFR